MLILPIAGLVIQLVQLAHNAVMEPVPILKVQTLIIAVVVAKFVLRVIVVKGAVAGLLAILMAIALHVRQTLIVAIVRFVTADNACHVLQTVV